MTKLDPGLLEKMEKASSTEQGETLDVIVALAKAADEPDLAQLRRAGLALRSTIGDIVTGSIRVGDLQRLAESSLVVQIEGSRPLYPEEASDESEN